MVSRLRATLLASTAAAAIVVSVTAAAGGRTIALAPTIPLGQEQLNTLNGIDFWRVPLEEGDRLTLRYDAFLSGKQALLKVEKVWEYEDTGRLSPCRTSRSTCPRTRSRRPTVSSS